MNINCFLAVFKWINPLYTYTKQKSTTISRYGWKIVFDIFFKKNVQMSPKFYISGLLSLYMSSIRHVKLNSNE